MYGEGGKRMSQERNLMFHQLVKATIELTFFFIKPTLMSKCSHTWCQHCLKVTQSMILQTKGEIVAIFLQNAYSLGFILPI